MRRSDLLAAGITNGEPEPGDRIDDVVSAGTKHAEVLPIKDHVVYEDWDRDGAILKVYTKSIGFTPTGA